MRKRKLIGFAILLLAVACWAQKREPSMVLPASEAKAANRLCSRSGPGKVDGGWVPEANDIAALEARLNDIPKLKSGGYLANNVRDPFSFYRQYVGIVIDGKRLIYVNAFLPSDVPKDWKTRLVDYCDGGSSLWGVLFNPATGTFSDFETNGLA